MYLLELLLLNSLLSPFLRRCIQKHVSDSLLRSIKVDSMANVVETFNEDNGRCKLGSDDRIVRLQGHAKLNKLFAIYIDPTAGCTARARLAAAGLAHRTVLLFLSSSGRMLPQQKRRFRLRLSQTSFTLTRWCPQDCESYTTIVLYQ